MIGAPIPEGVLKVIAEVARRRGLLTEALLSPDQGVAATAARGEVYARLLRQHTARAIAAWMGRSKWTITKGAKAYRDRMGLAAPKAVRSFPARPVLVLSLWRGWVKAHAGRRRMDDICAEVAGLYGYTVDQIKGPDRDQEICVARHHCMWAMGREPHLSLPRIGKFLNRDHTTVLHGQRRHAERMAREWPEGLAA
ncbi:helix-turn-helix domain-containing protein [Caulobacter sp.]|uniref:helix-turn-helix domain-containing protein n=1 Tax=Caulobacter sp. TaxID=78 RepID=UPI003BB00985